MIMKYEVLKYSVQWININLRIFIQLLKVISAKDKKYEKYGFLLDEESEAQTDLYCSLSAITNERVHP